MIEERCIFIVLVGGFVLGVFGSKVVFISVFCLVGVFFRVVLF